MCEMSTVVPDSGVLSFSPPSWDPFRELWRGSPPPLPRACWGSSPSRVAGHCAPPCPPPALPGSSPARADTWPGRLAAGAVIATLTRACSPLPAPRPRPPRAGAGFSSLLCSSDHSDGEPHHSGERGGDAEGLSTSRGTFLSRPVVLSVLSCVTGRLPRPAWSDLPCLSRPSPWTGAELSLPLSLTLAASTSQGKHVEEHGSRCPPPAMGVCTTSRMLGDPRT